ncbi:SDR family NAD(P)-dependent oxidoreductase [Granulicella sp. 5B5]|uniref:SDR family oxidoreductase n=1 Tax=Granulicella sp. 5B5 TaxID=1617967 RepID=UPI0015F4ACCD|nr:SDR family NAD(P)-dependent oxidoreductase [Granulicella sp. 5B5]QMV17432.1 SDR family NAD(P)-dependent oxidoreductase [Granulicella sp. 5B5]
MKLTGNTVFITGGGSGIGQALAEAFHRRGNQVIISGRRRSALDETLAANPGMAAIELDVQSLESIQSAAQQLTREYPQLNVVINNAGIMLPDSAGSVQDDAQLLSTVMTNLIGPIRVTSALIEHLKAQTSATIVYNTSVLGFVPMAVTSVYSATKAALHSYVLSQRYKLRDSSVRVIELAPPWVRTDLMNSREAEAAMPLSAFMEQVMQQLGTDAFEILAGNAPALRANPGPEEYSFVENFNASLPF